MVLLSVMFNHQIISFYLEATTNSFSLTKHGFAIYVWAFLVMGINFFTSMMFTGISDAKHSIIIALLRSFVFIFIAIIILPNIFGIDGVWLALPVSETLTFVVSMYFYIKYFRNRFKD